MVETWSGSLAPRCDANIYKTLAPAPWILINLMRRIYVLKQSFTSAVLFWERGDRCCCYWCCHYCWQRGEPRDATGIGEGKVVTVVMMLSCLWSSQYRQQHTACNLNDTSGSWLNRQSTKHNQPIRTVVVWPSTKCSFSQLQSSLIYSRRERKIRRERKKILRLPINALDRYHLTTFPLVILPHHKFRINNPVIYDNHAPPSKPVMENITRDH